LKRLIKVILFGAEGKVKSLEDIGEIVVKNINEYTCLYKNVADVRFGSANRFAWHQLGNGR
jgi:Cu/Ag efflux pump CusA